MNTEESYNLWASQYDSNENKTRDLEAVALRAMMADLHFDHVLEIGCGTGKNSSFFADCSVALLAVDLSEEMLAKAREKVQAPNVRFIQADINKPWQFGQEKYDLVSFSLVLEHINNLDPIFEASAKALRAGGRMYIGELHPFKQYTGTKARFT